MENIKNERILLNGKSILDCKDEADYEKHSVEISRILDYLTEHAKAGAIMKVQPLDIARRNEPPTYMYAAMEDSYYDALDSFDLKNGIDFVINKGELAALIYGSNYTAYNYDRTFMERSLVTYHFINDKQMDHNEFIKNGMNFINDTDSQSLKQGFLSVVYSYDEFFMGPELTNELKMINTVTLDEKIHGAVKRKETEMKKNDEQISKPDKDTR